jgi:hypothetical protein
MALGENGDGGEGHLFFQMGLGFWFLFCLGFLFY